LTGRVLRYYGAILKQADLISISEASQILGVNEATLRQWTDECKLAAFVTPGGHRRYSRSDLKKFTKPCHKTIGIKDLVTGIEDTTNRHRELARSFLDNSTQMAVAGEENQKKLAGLGRRLLALTAKYVSEPARRGETLTEAQGVGSSFGRLLAEIGLPLTSAVSAFLVHREPIMQAASHLMAKREAQGSRIMEAIPLTNHFIDETLISMIAAYQQYCTENVKGGAA
jgi:excisionase family DNA binding protein